MGSSSVRRGIRAAAALVLLGGCDTGSGKLSGAGGAGTITPTGSGGAPVTGQNCGLHRREASRVPPDILILLDTSTSMNGAIDGVCLSGCGPRSKWGAAVAAIDAVVGATGGAVNWGLAFMATGMDSCDADGITLPVGASSYSLQESLRIRSNGGLLGVGTNRPTRTAVKLASAYLSGRPPGPTRAILLLTDGVPACMPGAPDALGDDSDGTVAAIQSAANQGITTYLVGLATSGGPASAALSRMAVAGGRARAGDPAYVPAAASADIVTAMNDLVAEVAACTFAVPPPPTSDGSTSRGFINVEGDGIQIPRDPLNGWTYTDASMTAVVLHGPACDAVRSGAITSVSIVFYCDGGP